MSKFCRLIMVALSFSQCLLSLSIVLASTSEIDKMSFKDLLNFKLVSESNKDLNIKSATNTLVMNNQKDNKYGYSDLNDLFKNTLDIENTYSNPWLQVGQQGSSIAANFSHTKLEDLLNLKVISASKRLENINTAPSTIVVITQKDIRKYGYRNLKDLLKHTLGIEYGDPSSWLQGGQRGFVANFSQTKLLIDGRETNLLWTGESYIANQYTLNNVKQVEIIHGPASALYGADAVVGVINIITKSTQNSENENNISLAYNTESAKEVSFSTIFKKSAISGNLAGTFFNQDGPDFKDFVLSDEHTLSEVDERRKMANTFGYEDYNEGYNVKGEVGYELTKNARLSVGALWLKSLDGGGQEQRMLVYDMFEDTREQLHYHLKHLDGQIVYYNNWANEIIKEDRSQSDSINRNIGSKTVHGIENRNKWRYKKFDGFIDIGWLEDKHDSKFLDIANYKVHLGISYRFIDQLNLSLIGKHTSPINTEISTQDELYEVKSYNSVDLILYAQDIKILDVFEFNVISAVHNIFDSKNLFPNVRGKDPHVFLEEARSLSIEINAKF